MLNDGGVTLLKERLVTVLQSGQSFLSSPFLGKQEKEVNYTTHFLSAVFTCLTLLQWSQRLVLS